MSITPSIIARYSQNHINEGNYTISSFVQNTLKIFTSNINIATEKTMVAQPWYIIEENLILLFQIASLIFAATSFLLVILAVLKKEKSIYYATGVLISAYSVYFVNPKLSLVILFLVFIAILNLRKKVGINT